MYAEACFKALGDKVDYWCTVNEPSINCMAAYAYGSNAPFLKDMNLAIRDSMVKYFLLDDFVFGEGCFCFLMMVDVDLFGNNVLYLVVCGDCFIKDINISYNRVLILL